MMLRYTRKTNDHGVSESIGFMLIFAIIIVGIGLVTLYGYPLLIQQQVSADEQIMEKNMIVLQNDIKSLAYKTVPYKETSLKIGGGSLTVYNSSYSPSTSSKLDIENAEFGGVVSQFKSGELRYESVSAQTDISLQNGAVVMRPRVQSGSTMLAEPRWFYDAQTRTMVFNLMNITSNTIMAKEGIGTVRMNLGETNYNIYTPTVDKTLTIIYTPGNPDYSVAWGNYFTRTLGMTQTGPNTYTLANVDKIVIKKYEVQIKNI